MSEDLEQSYERLPRAPIDRLTAPINRFLHIEAASGVVLLLAAVAAFALANSPAGDAFLAFWKTSVTFSVGLFEMNHSLQHWVSDGLMTLFFFVVGLEVKREMVHGQLSDARQAALPIAAAIGGMLVPAGIFLALQWGEPTARGWGIPMATDIAFVVGCMALLGSRVPIGLRVLVLSLAIADDIGAILVIAIGYTDDVNTTALALSALGVAGMVGLRFAGVRAVSVYALAAVATWVAFHESGVHATIEGVVLGLLTPTSVWVSDSRLEGIVSRAGAVLEGEGWSQARRRSMLGRVQTAVREAVSPQERLEFLLHPWSAFVIMPIFALANAGVEFQAALITEPVAVAVAVALVLGKPIGIVGFSAAAIALGVARLPDGVGWGALTGGGFLAGIGFTMSLFISGLALEGYDLDAAKVGVLGASVVAGIVGMTILAASLPAAPDAPEE